MIQKKKIKIIGVILAYNCAKMLPRAYQRIPHELFDDLILMDDGSRDNTSEVAKKLGLKVFRHFPNRGYGGNLKEGLKKAVELGADYVVEIHGDGAQFNPISLKYALKPMKKGIQFIYGSRFKEPGSALKNGMPIIRFIANRFLSFFDRLILGLPLTEFHSGFSIYGKELIKKIPYENNSNNHLFSFEILAQIAYYRFKVVEVPVEADYKNEHSSLALPEATIFAFQTFIVLFKFILARFGLMHTALFPELKPEDRNVKEY